MPARPHILLLRHEVESDPYVSAFEAIDFEARCVPVLRFEPMGGTELGECLRAAHTFGGLILTSPRAAEVLEGHDLRPWRAKPVFVAGPGTADRVRALGLQPVGEVSGSAEALADRIVRFGLQHPALFLCGDRRRDVLPDRLRTASMAFRELVVYRTVTDTSRLGAGIREKPDWVGFFSPSGVEAALELDGISWNSVARAAIGPTTADALRTAGLSPHAVAAAPTPEALASSVSHVHRSADV